MVIIVTMAANKRMYPPIPMPQSNVQEGVYLSMWPYPALPSFEESVLQSFSSILHLDGGICQLQLCQFDMQECNQVHNRARMICWESTKKQTLTETKCLRSDGTKTMKVAFMGTYIINSNHPGL
jgi:hypothetical protein